MKIQMMPIKSFSQNLNMLIVQFFIDLKSNFSKKPAKKIFTAMAGK